MTEIIKQEQGRSMVEMLGVLAVVGVLSVGGIAGYTYAMDKHKSNELLNEASKRAVIVAAQIAAGREPSLREFEDNETAGGTISTEPATDIDGGVGIRVSGVKESVCKNLVKLENDVMYVAKDDKTLSEVTEADCSGDNNAFMIVFENMGGDSGDGTTVTCDESEKVSVTYTGGRCCDETKTGKFCPGDEPPTCVRDAGCDCSDESCCNTLGGSWASGGGGSICCAEGTALCPEDGDCICVPEGYNSDCTYTSCIACLPSEGTVKCSDSRDCICVPDGYDSTCGEWGCIACPPGQTASCADDWGEYESNCGCQEIDFSSCEDEYCCNEFGGSWAKNAWGEYSICCAEGTALCPDEGSCICVPEGYSSDCTYYSCVACSPSEGTAKCSEWGTCICVPNGYSSRCSATECKACPSGETAKCASEGDCICVPSGYSGACNCENCISCPSGKTPTCEGDYGDCTCS